MTNNFINSFFLNVLLNSNKKVLFIHSNEEYICHKKSRDDKVILYDYLCKINDIIKEKYPNLTFEIITPKKRISNSLLFFLDKI